MLDHFFLKLNVPEWSYWLSFTTVSQAKWQIVINESRIKSPESFNQLTNALLLKVCIKIADLEIDNHVIQIYKMKLCKSTISNFFCPINISIQKGAIDWNLNLHQIVTYRFQWLFRWSHPLLKTSRLRHAADVRIIRVRKVTHTVHLWRTPVTVTFTVVTITISVTVITITVSVTVITITVSTTRRWPCTELLCTFPWFSLYQHLESSCINDINMKTLWRMNEMIVTWFVCCKRCIQHGSNSHLIWHCFLFLIAFKECYIILNNTSTDNSSKIRHCYYKFIIIACSIVRLIWVNT